MIAKRHVHHLIVLQKMLRYASLLLLFMFTSGCAMQEQDCRTITWELGYYNNGVDYPELKGITRKTEKVLSASKVFLDSELRGVDALSLLFNKLESLLSSQMNALLAEYLNAYALGVQSGATERLYYSHFDPLLNRRWQPNAEVLDFGSDYLPQRVITVNELLLSAKILTGYQGKSDFIFKQEEGKWLLDEVVISRRYDYDKAKWEKEAVSKTLSERIQELSRETEKGEQAAAD